MVLTAALALVLAACGDGGGPGGGSGGGAGGARGNSPGAASPAQAGTPGGASAGATGGQTGGGTGGGAAEPAAVDAPDAVARAARWNLRPFAPAPPPPAVKPVRTGGAVPPVFDRVPTGEKIVFVTIDDGAEKDPMFVEMLRDLRVPVTMFLTDSYVRENPDYFRQLRDTGFATAQNHSLTHANLVTLGADGQRREVCGQQERLAAEFGTAPYLLRAPYGNSDAVTQQVAGTCGVRAIVKWRESMQRNDMQYQGPKVLRPGDIILAHFRGPSELGGMTMTQMMGNLFRKIQAQGFTIARLEDYV